MLTTTTTTTAMQRNNHDSSTKNDYSSKNNKTTTTTTKRKGQITETVKLSEQRPPLDSVVREGPRIEKDSKSSRSQQTSERNDYCIIGSFYCLLHYCIISLLHYCNIERQLNTIQSQETSVGM